LSACCWLACWLEAQPLGPGARSFTSVLQLLHRAKAEANVKAVEVFFLTLCGRNDLAKTDVRWNQELKHAYLHIDNSRGFRRSPVYDPAQAAAACVAQPAQSRVAPGLVKLVRSVLFACFERV
jgi:hypothetical protein